MSQHAVTSEEEDMDNMGIDEDEDEYEGEDEEDETEGVKEAEGNHKGEGESEEEHDHEDTLEEQSVIDDGQYKVASSTSLSVRTTSSSVAVRGLGHLVKQLSVGGTPA